MKDIRKSELEQARWNGTDSTFEGWIVGRYTKLSGKPMVVLEDERGLNHIYPVSDRLEVARSDLASASAGGGEDELCSDCPPVGYDHDRTRCVVCPRRPAHAAPEAGGFNNVDRQIEWLRAAAERAEASKSSGEGEHAEILRKIIGSVEALRAAHARIAEPAA